jgi:hypothetical protein
LQIGSLKIECRLKIDRQIKQHFRIEIEEAPDSAKKTDWQHCSADPWQRRRRAAGIAPHAAPTSRPPVYPQEEANQQAQESEAMIRGLARIAISSVAAVGKLVIAAVFGTKFAQRTRRFALITTGSTVCGLGLGITWWKLKPYMEVSQAHSGFFMHHIVSTFPLVILAAWSGFLFGALLCVLDSNIDRGDESRPSP